MKNNSFTLPFFIILVLSFTVNAQWTDNGTYITTLDKVGIGTSSIGITGTGVNTLVIGNGISSQGLVVNAGSVNDAILSFASNGALTSRFIYNNPTGSLHYFKSGGLGNLFTVDSSGNFGIGTSTPSEKLEVDGITLSNTFRSVSSNTDFHHFMRNGVGSAVYINQVSSDSSFPILRLSSGTASANNNVKFTVENNGNVGIGTTTPASRLDIKIGSSETVRMLDFTDGNYRIGSVEKLSSNDGVGLVLSGYTKTSVTEANPTLVLKGYTKDLAPNNEYDAAVTVRGYNVEDDTELQNIPIFKVLNAHSVAHLTVAASGNVGIGTSSPDSKLAVNGTIHTKEVKVDLTGWSDFVFEDDYDLPSLTELESFISKNKHLPNVPTEAEVLENGVKLGEMNAKLLQKIEELTLYLIDQNKKIEKLQKEISELKEEK